MFVLYSLFSALPVHLQQLDFHDSRLGRPFVKAYEQESYGKDKAYEQESYGKDDVLSAVEKCMKNDVLREETGHRLKSLEKHLSEVN